MGLMDKVKETAAKTADAAKGVAKTGQEKIEEQKLKKRIGELKEDLGGVVYADRTGAASPTADASTDAAIERLVNEIREQEEALAAVGDDDDTEDGPAAASDTSDTTDAS